MPSKTNFTRPFPRVRINSRRISGREATTGNTSAVRMLPISGQVVLFRLFPEKETWMIFKIALFKLFITVFCSIHAIVSEVPLMYDVVVYYTVHQRHL